MKEVSQSIMEILNSDLLLTQEVEMDGPIKLRANGTGKQKKVGKEYMDLLDSVLGEELEEDLVVLLH